MSSHIDDAWIDNELRNVAIPADLIHRLKCIVSLDDAEIDHALCDVDVPKGLLERLGAIGSLSDIDLNDELRHVVAPVSLADRLRRIPLAARHLRHRRLAMRRFAIAASLLVAAGLGYLAATLPSSLSRAPRPSPDSRTTVATTNNSQQTKESVASSGSQIAEGSPEVGAERSIAPADIASARETPKSRDSLDTGSVPTAVEHETGSSDISPPVTALGASASLDPLPPLQSVSVPKWRGLSPPHERGYDLIFELRYGIHPLVSPSSNPALAICPVPLVTDTESFDAAFRLAAEHKLLAAQRIRTEEFLAAMDYGFPMPGSGSVGIRTALGPSPWGAPGTSLLQVAAQAGMVAVPNSSGSHLIVLLDASDSMNWERRWDNVLAGLDQYIARMQPNDRLSVVVGGEKAYLAGEQQSAPDASRTIKSLIQKPIAKSVNLAEALVLAADVAGRGLAVGPGRIMLVSDGMPAFDPSMSERIESSIRASVKDGHRFEVLDVRQDETIDSQLDRIVAAAVPPNSGRGAVVHASIPVEMRWRFLEFATGKSQDVAKNTTMNVTFKPDAVAMYRLLGHEATSVAGLVSSTAVEVNLRAGEAATGLFEVVLKPDGGDTIATVEVTWRDPANGATRSTRQAITRLQFAPSFHQAPMSLQMAALAAETAEVMRNSYFPPASSHSLSSIAELGAQLNPRLRNRPSFARLMTLVEQAQRSQGATQ